MDSKKLDKLSEIGAKARSLFLLKENHFDVPPFIVLKFSELKTISTQREIGIREIQLLIQDQLLPDCYYAIRSSSAIEDGEKQSFAGQFKTLLGISKNEISNAVWEILIDFRKRSHEAYSDQENNQYGIIIQELIEPEYAGVGFSTHPFDSDNEAPQITIVPGGGEGLVSGKYESLIISKNENRFHYQGIENRYFGESLVEKSPVLPRTGIEIKHEIEAFLPVLFDGIKKLEQLLETPVDVEFALSKKQLYWLQVRPITSLGEKTIAIWDNTACEANYSGITLSLTQSLVRRSFEYAYGGLAKKLGLKLSNTPINEALKNMSGEINGVLYYNVSAWQQLITQLPFGKKAAAKLPDMWGMDTVSIKSSRETSFLNRVTIFFRLITLLFSRKNLKKTYTKQLNETLHSVDSLKNMNADELKTNYLRTEKILGDNWVAPTVNGFFALLFLSISKKMLRNSHLSEKYPNFLNDILMQEDEVITVRMIRDFQSLILQIQSDSTCFLFFNEKQANEIDLTLPHAFPLIDQQITSYIEKYGSRAEKDELKLETTPFHQNRATFIAYLSKNLTLTIHAKKEKLNDKEIIRSHFPFYSIKRIVLPFCLKQAILRVSDRENYRFDRTKVFDYIRQLVQHLEQQLINSNQLAQRGDIYFLSFEDLFSEENLKDIVATRKKQLKENEVIQSSTRYRQTKNGFEAVYPTLDASDLKGIGCCSGIVEGEIIVFDKHLPNELYSNKIVIAEYFEPSNIALFTSAAGLISSRGNLLSHTSILCREMGVPSIVGVKGLMQHLQTGDRVKMDGASGQLKKMES